MNSKMVFLFIALAAAGLIGPGIQAQVKGLLDKGNALLSFGGNGQAILRRPMVLVALSRFPQIGVAGALYGYMLGPIGLAIPLLFGSRRRPSRSRRRGRRRRR